MNLLFETESKTVPITKEMVRAAYRKVKSNNGSAGVDRESLEEFQQDLSGNLHKIWNRLASGSYHPQAVREVEIPKANGGKRKLGIPKLLSYYFYYSWLSGCVLQNKDKVGIPYSGFIYGYIFCFAGPQQFADNNRLTTNSRGFRWIQPCRRLYMSYQ